MKNATAGGGGECLWFQKIVSEIKKLGCVLLIGLANIVGVELYHVEKQAQEIDYQLQECSSIALAEIVAQLQDGSELLVTVWSLDLDPW
ncbi:hypothetical protein L2E82_39285 [Cichorium intybus]|uniref:Uncharacterized protein n=1 Tax=Cichorium intybus TaxID=13427 RepID=A0ACB9AIK5_CICIN|nr:hypothetical protein L2E82_39285 [Cichorium intybus]